MSQIEEEYKRARQKDAKRRAIQQTRPKKDKLRHKGRGRSHDGELSEADDERIMPRDENERRRLVENMLAHRNVLKTDDDLLTGPGEIEGQVVEVMRGACRVAVSDGHLECSISGTLNTAKTGFTNLTAVGDRVMVLPIDEIRGVVNTILPRHSVLARREVHHGYQKQAIVANADQVLITAAWREPNFWPELVDRYLVTAALNQLHPILCITKIDLVDDPAEFEVVIAPYRSLELDLVLTSVKTGVGIDQLTHLLNGKQSVLVGLSGVGKSTLLNALKPDLALKTGNVSESSLFRGQGRHTTTGAALFRLESGGTVVDTPGIREFGLVGLRRHELAEFYPEFASVVGGCRFNDCLHITEPGCAVREALETGWIHVSRYATYCKILSSLNE
jgi:ribosome biogenesis GTPase / thiamine phosphate phosphatase